MTERTPGPLARLRRLVANVPPIRAYRRRAYARAFAARERVNLYHGVYGSFEEAERSAPASKPTGYDNTASAQMYDADMSPTLRDYPALFWLHRAIASGSRRVFDLGGHIGIKYYAFRDRLSIPTHVSWQVCDVPAVVARGRALALERGVDGQLRFTIDWEEMAQADVLFASGSLQYLPTPLGAMLRRLPTLPSRIVINNAALHPTRSFFTLNSTGVAFCPYRVQSEPSLGAELEELGYDCVDRWETPKSFEIPFESGYGMDRFVGMAFERRVTGR
jgi:putative methyltransferase (TIGR04325 family)